MRVSFAITVRSSLSLIQGTIDRSNVARSRVYGRLSSTRSIVRLERYRHQSHAPNSRWKFSTRVRRRARASSARCRARVAPGSPEARLKFRWIWERGHRDFCEELNTMGPTHSRSSKGDLRTPLSQSPESGEVATTWEISEVALLGVWGQEWQGSRRPPKCEFERTTSAGFRRFSFRR